MPYDGTSPLYGTTLYGGANNHGTLFELWPPIQGKAWTERALYSFCPQAGCTDGANPGDNPVADQTRSIYGVTEYGGKYDRGVVYELSPELPEKHWTETVLHNFEAYAGGVGSDTLAVDASGNLYGPAPGGNYGQGSLFELARSGSKWKFLTLYSFCERKNCEDGADPYDVIIDSSGDFCGVTSLGGNMNHGTVFRLVPDGSKWKQSVLYSFCSQPHCADGEGPVTLTLGPDGDLFGTTAAGGAYPAEEGVAFELKAR